MTRRTTRRSPSRPSRRSVLSPIPEPRHRPRPVNDQAVNIATWVVIVLAVIGAITVLRLVFGR